MNSEEATFERGQFTFYRSFREAAKSLSTKDRLKVYEAIIDYGLDGCCDELTGVPLAMFLLVKPTLDNSRKKSAVGKQGGSKPKANRKGEQAAREKENEKEKEGEKEKEKEIEIENDSYKPTSPFDEFWNAYPKKVGKADAKKAFAKAKAPVDRLLSAIEQQKKSDQWTREGGRYIPNPATWLNQGRWDDELPEGRTAPNSVHGCTGMGEAEMEAIRRMMEEEA